MDFYVTSVIQGLAYSSMSLGIFLTLRIFRIPDITPDGSYTLGGAATAVILISGYSPWLALIASLICGTVAGLFTGLIHTRLGVNALLAGILVMTGLYSVNLGIMGRPNIPLIDTMNILRGNELIVILFFIASDFLILFLFFLL